MQILLQLALCVGAFAQFNQNGINDLLRVHNTMRSKIAKGEYTAQGLRKPAAANMNKLYWNTTLANSAQNFVNTCPPGHSGYPELGENYYFMTSPADLGELNKYAAKSAEAWEKEFADFGWPKVVFDQDSVSRGIGHATQMAWAKTDQVGCGVKNCKVNGWNKVIVVCQYYKQANYLGMDVYKQGSTCSKCLKNKSCEQSTGLCQ